MKQVVKETKRKTKKQSVRKAVNEKDYEAMLIEMLEKELGNAR